MTLNDSDFGIGAYQYGGNPLGGSIKNNYSDFKVTEVDPTTSLALPRPPQEYSNPFESGGMFLLGRVWRQGHDHGKMVNLLAKTFGVAEEDVSTAGIKDARAEIVQLFSVYNPRKSVADPSMLDIGLEIDGFSTSRERLYPGRMGGNHFDINIRGCKIIEEYELDYFGALAENSLLNYYGYQRFGSWRPITASLGRAIVRGNYEEAVNLYLGGKSNFDDEIYRAHWRENQDPDELLLIWDGIPDIEAKLLKHLSKRNHDYRGATSKFPKYLINISKSAFISYLTNIYFSKRGDKKEPLRGEREFDENIEIALPSNRWTQPLNHIWKEIFDSQKIDLKKDLGKIRHTSRLLFLSLSNWEAKYIDDTTVNVKFQLKNGQYATTVLRELMQVNPEGFF